MAWGEKPTASLTFSMIDETGSRGSLSLDVPQATLADAALTAAAAFRPLIEAMTDCAVVGYTLTYGSFDDAMPAPTAGSRIERKGVFQFRTSAGKLVKYQVPGISSSVVKRSGAIDEDRPAIQAFAQALTALDAIFCDSNGADLRSLYASWESFRSTTKGQTPRDRTPDADILPEIIDPTP